MVEEKIHKETLSDEAVENLEEFFKEWLLLLVLEFPIWKLLCPGIVQES